MISVNDFKTGAAFVRSKLKNLRTGAVQEKTFRAGEKVAKAQIDNKKMQYLYDDGDNYVFMDMQSYEQIEMPKQQVAEEMLYVLENTELTVIMYGNEVLGVDLPNTVTLEVAETEPNIKGDTSSGGSKPAVMETGLTVNVPFFVNQGDKLIVNTQDGSYVSRA